ncbi:MAG: hypothetical protein HY328_11675 [Chloroflexi bacterium]|nr:hypothetical protein [Chloroflexota bacterium]
MNSSARALVYTLVALLLAAAAFAGGYWLRGQTAPMEVTAAATTGVPDDATAVWNGELFRQVWLLLEQD